MSNKRSNEVSINIPGKKRHIDDDTIEQFSGKRKADDHSNNSVTKSRKKQDQEITALSFGLFHNEYVPSGHINVSRMREYYLVASNSIPCLSHYFER